MAVITDIFAAFSAALAAFFGHLVAHDFTEFTPKLSRSLIRRAAGILPKRHRSRYREEWLADLNERTGVFAKLRHAFGCLRCARRMRWQSERYVRSMRKFRFEIRGVGEIELDSATALWAVNVLIWWSREYHYRWLNEFRATFLAWQ